MISTHGVQSLDIVTVTYLMGKRNTRGSATELGIFDHRPRSREPDCVDLITLCVLSRFTACCASPSGTLLGSALSYGASRCIKTEYGRTASCACLCHQAPKLHTGCGLKNAGASNRFHYAMACISFKYSSTRTLSCSLDRMVVPESSRWIAEIRWVVQIVSRTITTELNKVGIMYHLLRKIGLRVYPCDKWRLTSAAGWRQSDCTIGHHLLVTVHR
jgi:hypothetical protein